MTDIRQETIQERSTSSEDCFNMDNLTNDGTQKRTDSAVALPSIEDTEGSEKESHVTSAAPVEGQQSESVVRKSSDEESSLDLAAEVSEDDSEWEDITTDDDSDLEDDSESDITTDDELSDSSASSNANPSDKSELEANKSDSGSRKRKYDITNFKEILGVEPQDIVNEILAEKNKLMPLVSVDKKVELLQCYEDEINLIQETLGYFAAEALKSTKSLMKRYKRVCKKQKIVDK